MMQMGFFSSLFGLIVFILDVYAIAMIWGSGEEMPKKILWIALVLLLPFIGFVIWYFAGPRGVNGRNL